MSEAALNKKIKDWINSIPDWLCLRWPQRLKYRWAKARIDVEKFARREAANKLTDKETTDEPKGADR